ncbi:MAG: aryl-sulfate sulfotransferase [Phycisphaerae bacterium]|nr:aryl-sulfate sulfotransferase [Phycisphaerae bacterium]
MTRTTILCLLLTTIALSGMLAGCGGSKTDDGKEAKRDNAAEIEKLRGIGYLGGTEIEDDGKEGLTVNDVQRSCPGYNLYTVWQLSRAELIDENAEVVRTWQYPRGSIWEHCELLPNGDLVIVGADRRDDDRNGVVIPIADNKRYIMRQDWDGNIIWKQSFNSHHDIELTPDGNLVALTFIRRLVPQIHPTVPTRDDQITLLRPDGTFIRSLSMINAISSNPSAFPMQPVKPSTLGGAPWMDLFHSNAIEWMHHANLFDKSPLYASDNILVCFRHQNRIAIFSWTGQAVVWSWGADELMGPHDAQVLENGHITVFDNGLGRGYSRAVELDPLTGKVVWEYKADPPSSFYTASKGSMQRLPNGNTLLAESDRGRAFEITPEGECVWEFISPHRINEHERAAIVRMKRYPHSYIDTILEDHGGAPATQP